MVSKFMTETFGSDGYGNRDETSHATLAEARAYARRRLKVGSLRPERAGGTNVGNVPDGYNCIECWCDVTASEADRLGRHECGGVLIYRLRGDE
jgi:hypothetical protein